MGDEIQQLREEFQVWYLNIFTVRQEVFTNHAPLLTESKFDFYKIKKYINITVTFFRDEFIINPSHYRIQEVKGRALIIRNRPRHFAGQNHMGDYNYLI